MDKTFKLESEFTLEQLLMLRVFTGKLSGLTELYYETKDILKLNGIDSTPYDVMHIYDKLPDIRHATFRADCIEHVENSKRKTVIVGGKKYYEDDLAKALTKIEEVR